MTKLFPFFWMIPSVCAMCISGFIAAQNLAAQVDGMMGRWTLPFWDRVWTDWGIHLSFTFVAVFGAIFGAISYVVMRYGILTRNHVLIILIGIVLFTIGLEFA